jgi:hypothetical protein
MPTISAFFGITIRMYYDDHPPPHFHAYYAEHSARIAIDTLAVSDGGLPKRALGMVIEWAVAHREELRANWDRAARHEALATVEPLE